ncbi:MAG: hypothetical protein LQ340_003614 [Diploschistes diacapsis]|nr:MAG: hypothetical protein LQ340_003614 [Diploschistes diacapsis]
MASSSSSSRTLDNNGITSDHDPSLSSKKPSHFTLLTSHSVVTPAVRYHHYPGSGTPEDPYSVEFIPNDPRNPMLFFKLKRWFIAVVLGIATLAVSFSSSAYSGGVQQVIEQFQCTEQVATLGISLFVLGFAIGPLLWAPMSELYGRQVLYFGTYGVLTAFNAAAAGSQNMQTLLILRFFAGAFGSSPLTNAGGVIADMFPANERGLAMALFSMAPFMGPALGPIVGGFVGESIGWRWLEGLLAIFSGAAWVLGVLTIPETYAPVLLRARAASLSKQTGKHYVSKLDLNKPPQSPSQLFKTNLSRPWILLFREPIVTITSIYMAIVYGTLYLLFAAYPIVYQQQRGWSQGVGGLAFIGVAVGFLAAIGYVIPDNGRYARLNDEAKARGEYGAAPEERLRISLAGSVLLPVGLFWFAWTNGPEISWAASVVAGIPFGAGMVLVFLVSLRRAKLPRLSPLSCLLLPQN